MLETTNQLYKTVFNDAQNLTFEEFREKHFPKSHSMSWTEPKTWDNYAEACYQAARTANAIWKTEREALPHFLWWVETQAFEHLRVEKVKTFEKWNK